ncbi:unnamed protein product, partial [Pocillopora meandrina]
GRGHAKPVKVTPDNQRRAGSELLGALWAYVSVCKWSGMDFLTLQFVFAMDKISPAEVQNC